MTLEEQLGHGPRMGLGKASAPQTGKEMTGKAQLGQDRPCPLSAQLQVAQVAQVVQVVQVASMPSANSVAVVQLAAPPASHN